jgi:integrase
MKMNKPKPIPGVEIRERRRHGETYYRFRVRFTNAAGRRDQETFDTPEEALDFKAQLRLMKRRGNLSELDAGQQTLEELMVDFWRLYAKRRLAEVTRRKYRGTWNKYIHPLLGPMQLRQITPMALSEFIAEMEDAGASAGTIRAALGMLQSMFARAVEWGRASINVVKQISKPSAPRLRAIVPLTPESIERIRIAMLELDPVRGVRDAALVSVLAYTGARPEEAVALDCRHIGENTVLVEQKVCLGVLMRGQKTNRPPRSARLFAVVRCDVRSYQMACGVREGLLFPFEGGPWTASYYRNWRNRVWQPACVAAGVGRIEVTKKPGGKTKRTYRGPRPYDLRHSLASLLIHEGEMSVVEIANSLGHSTETLLRVYAHVIAELSNKPKLNAEAVIAEARLKLSGETVGRAA